MAGADSIIIGLLIIGLLIDEPQELQPEETGTETVTGTCLQT